MATLEEWSLHAPHVILERLSLVLSRRGSSAREVSRLERALTLSYAREAGLSPSTKGSPAPENTALSRKNARRAHNISLHSTQGTRKETPQ